MHSFIHITAILSPIEYHRLYHWKEDWSSQIWHHKAMRAYHHTRESRRYRHDKGTIFHHWLVMRGTFPGEVLNCELSVWAKLPILNCGLSRLTDWQVSGIKHCVLGKRRGWVTLWEGSGTPVRSKAGHHQPADTCTHPRALDRDTWRSRSGIWY